MRGAKKRKLERGWGWGVGWVPLTLTASFCFRLYSLLLSYLVSLEPRLLLVQPFQKSLEKSKMREKNCPLKAGWGPALFFQCILHLCLQRQGSGGPFASHWCPLLLAVSFYSFLIYFLFFFWQLVFSSLNSPLVAASPFASGLPKFCWTLSVLLLSFQLFPCGYYLF